VQPELAGNANRRGVGATDSLGATSKNSFFGNLETSLRHLDETSSTFASPDEHLGALSVQHLWEEKSRHPTGLPVKQQHELR
jgi:hypothetical protein